MSDNQEETNDTVEASAKDKIYASIRDLVKDRTGKSIGKQGGREIFDLVVEQVFAAATAAGTFRFNGGFGSLHVRQYSAGTRNLPSGQAVTFGEREKLRYEEGVVTKALVANKGDLSEALKARGSRGGDKEVEEEPAKAEPAKADTKKADAKKVDTKKVDTKKAPPADADDVNLD